MSMGIDPQVFVRQMKEPIARSSIIYYPPQSRRTGRSSSGPPHRLRLPDPVVAGPGRRPGSAESSGGMGTAHPIEGTPVVNVGDLLMR